jgi:hypothetical protein
MSIEKILLDAHNRGIHKEVLERMDKYKHLMMEQKNKAEKAYNEVVAELTEKGTLERREWDSSLIQSTTYNYEKEALTVEFNNHQEYMYEEVSFNDYKEFCNAESQGKHFLANIRNSKKFQKVDGNQKN